MRLEAGRRCFARYRAELWEAPASAPRTTTGTFAIAASA